MFTSVPGYAHALLPLLKKEEITVIYQRNCCHHLVYVRHLGTECRPPPPPQTVVSSRDSRRAALRLLF